MTSLKIYDSEGQLIGDSREYNEQIQNFFFDGVRLSVDTSRGQQQAEIICFFRARSSSASRSEQYYAVYQGPTRKFTTTLERELEEKHNLSVVTTTEDTEIYQLLKDPPSVSNADKHSLDEIVELLNYSDSPQNGLGAGPHAGTPIQGGLQPQNEKDNSSLGRLGLGDNSEGNETAHLVNQAKLEAGTYRTALEGLLYLVQQNGINRIAIVDDANQSQLNTYDVVIQKGSGVGISPLPETQQALDALQAHRQKLRQQRYGGTDESGSGLSTVLLVAGVTSMVVGLLVLSIAGATYFGFSVPIVDSFLGGDADESSSIELEHASLDNTEEQLLIAGTLVIDDEESPDTTVDQVVTVETNTTEFTNETELNVSEGEMDTTIPVDGFESNETAGGNETSNESDEVATILGDLDEKANVTVTVEPDNAEQLESTIALDVITIDSVDPDGEQLIVEGEARIGGMEISEANLDTEEFQNKSMEAKFINNTAGTVESDIENKSLTADGFEITMSGYESAEHEEVEVQLEQAIDRTPIEEEAGSVET